MRLVVGIPDPNARPEGVGPREKEWALGDDSISGWAAAPPPGDPGSWTYFWLDGPIDSPRYRCYLESEPPAAWHPLLSAAEVFATTGYEGDDEEPDEEGAAFGAAERLQPGIYKLDFTGQHGGAPVSLEGIRFAVPAEGPASGTIVELGLEDEKKPWWKFW